MTLTHLQAALAWHDAGCSVIPVVADGSKKPMGSWKDYQEFRASRAKVERWFKTAPEQGVGLICGEVSEGLEMLEIEAVRMDSDSLDRVQAAMLAHDVLTAWNSLLEAGYCETTPSGGIHILYRIEDEKVPGNTKIALDVTGRVTYAETRGEGGFVVVAPTGGRVHKTGQSWTCVAGKIGTIPTITWNTRNLIHTALREALDERVMPVYERPAQVPNYDMAQGERPGDAYNLDPSVTVHDILLRNGWKYLGKSRGQDRYVHPLSSDMSTHSACTGYQGSENLYAWSGLPNQDYYTKFALLTHLEFNGDFSAATRHLRSQGYGAKQEPLDISDWFEASGVGVVVDAPTAAVEEPVVDTSKKRLRFEQFSEKGVGRYAGQVLKDRVRYVSQEKAWRVYSQGTWGRDHGQEVMRLVGRVSDVLDEQIEEIFAGARDALNPDDPESKEHFAEAKKLKTFAKGIATSRGLKAVAEIAATVPGVGVSADVFDHDLTKLAMANGTFDLESMTLGAHNPDYMLTKKIDISYDENAVASRWLRYLEEVIPDAEYREYLQRAVGMALLGDTSEAAFFVLWGETGCGKSQFIEVVNAVFGEYGVTAAASAFRESRSGDDSRKANSLHALRGARAVLTSETSKHSAIDGELVKRVTGGDSVKSHALYETEIEWVPRFTMFMGTNFKPNLDAGDGAIWRRVKPIEFPNSFFQDNRPTEDREKGLGQKIISTELAGVFNWVLDGIRSYRAIGLKDPNGLAETVKSYREDSDPVIGFLTESVQDGVLIKDAEASATVTELYRVFFNWSRENGVQRPLGKSKFSQRLEELGFKNHRGTGGVRYRKGLKLNTANFIASMQGGYR